MIIIGVDPHKRVHTATAVDAATNRRLASLEIDASLPGYRQLARWARSVGDRGRLGPHPNPPAPSRSVH